MPRIYPLNWKKFEKFLFFIGCEFSRDEGDHRIYWRSDLKRPVVIPREKELPIFIIRNNLRILNIGVEEYLKIFCLSRNNDAKFCVSTDIRQNKKPRRKPVRLLSDL